MDGTRQNYLSSCIEIANRREYRTSAFIYFASGDIDIYMPENYKSRAA